jgi:hypothetical protein
MGSRSPGAGYSYRTMGTVGSSERAVLSCRRVSTRLTVARLKPVVCAMRTPSSADGVIVRTGVRVVPSTGVAAAEAESSRCHSAKCELAEQKPAVCDGSHCVLHRIDVVVWMTIASADGHSRALSRCASCSNQRLVLGQVAPRADPFSALGTTNFKGACRLPELALCNYWETVRMQNASLALRRRGAKSFEFRGVYGVF